MTIVAAWLVGGIPAVCATAMAVDSASPPVAWQSVDGVRRQLEQPVTVSWSGVPLRQAVQNLARAQRVAIMLDRRVDPEQEIAITLTNVRLDEALARIATKVNFSVGRAGPVIYLGPPATAERLLTLVELRKQEINRLPPAARLALVAQKRRQWEMLATPRELLAEAARDHRVQIENPGDMPHDLWPAGDLPPLGLAERVSLIAAQFDLTFELTDDGRSIRLTPMPKRAVLEKSYNHANPAAAISKLKTVLKRSELDAGDKRLVVRGPAEEHEMVESLLSGKTVRQMTVTPGKKLYQLNVAMPVRRLIRELAPKLDLDVQIDEQAIARAGLNLEQDVKVSVKDASEEELLRAVLEPAGLTFERAGQKIVVRPK